MPIWERRRYLNKYYRSSEEADKFIKSDDQVVVKEIISGYEKRKH